MAAPESPVCYVGVARQSGAFRLMKQMGWEEGEGLVKDKQRIKGNIRVQNKQDTSGIGIEKPNNWAFDTTQFDNILKRLKVQAVQSSEEVMEKNTTKMEVETGVSVDHRDTIVKVTRPQGRYKKRERGKLVPEYSLKDLEGILVKKGDGSGADDDFVGELNLSNTSDDHNFEEGRKGQTQSPEWWGHKYGFISGRFRGADSRRKKSLISENTQKVKRELRFLKMIKRTSTHCSRQRQRYYSCFTMFLNCQEKSTAGKQGLGIKDRPKKVTGCYYQDKKTSFDDSEDEDFADIDSQEKQACDDTTKTAKHDESRVPGESLKLK